MVMVLGFTGCVTKQKYQELEARYRICNDDLTYTTAEKIDFENNNKDLSQQVGILSTQVEKLKSDTLSLSRRLRQSERDFAKSRRDYDELLKDFAELNLTNNNEVTKLLSDLDKIKGQRGRRS